MLQSTRPPPKPLISDPWQMCGDDFWGHLAPLWFWLCPWSHSPVSVLPGESDGHSPGWDPALVGDGESWDFPLAATSHPRVASSLELDAFQSRAVCSSFKLTRRERRWCLVLCRPARTKPAACGPGMGGPGVQHSGGSRRCDLIGGRPGLEEGQHRCCGMQDALQLCTSAAKRCRDAGCSAAPYLGSTEV